MLRRILKNLMSVYQKINGTERLYNSFNQKIDDLKVELFKLQMDGFFELPHLANTGKKKPQFIVTLTSYGNRIHTVLPYAICSLFLQSVLPDRIILWLSEKNITPRLKRLQELGLEIRFCDDIGSYKKLIPALIDFPDDVLISADDDIYYQKNWFFQLQDAYCKEPKKIHCHRALKIVFDKNKKMDSYLNWQKPIEGKCNIRHIFPTTGGGVIYPPYSFYHDVCDRNLFLRLAPKADDIWFWAMSVLKNTEIGVIKSGFSEIFEINPSLTGEIPLWTTNLDEDGNDKQLHAVLEHYPELETIVFGEI
jgi:hypothetical protein